MGKPIPILPMNRTAVLTLMVFFGLGTVRAQQVAPPPPIPGPGNLPAPEPAPAAPVPAPAPVPAAPVVPSTAAPAAPAPAAPATYTVQAGDNPWSIAKKNGVKLEDLLKANDIKDPKNLKIGDVLKLPAGATPKVEAPVAAKPAPTAPTAPATAPAGSDWDYYTVQKGDNPWKIAKALKVEHQKIVSLNEGVDFTKLKIGQQIKVPKKP